MFHLLLGKTVDVSQRLLAVAAGRGPGGAGREDMLRVLQSHRGAGGGSGRRGVGEGRGRVGGGGGGVKLKQEILARFRMVVPL